MSVVRICMSVDEGTSNAHQNDSRSTLTAPRSHARCTGMAPQQHPTRAGVLCCAVAAQGAAARPPHGLDLRGHHRSDAAGMGVGGVAQRHFPEAPPVHRCASKGRVAAQLQSLCLVHRCNSLKIATASKCWHTYAMLYHSSRHPCISMQLYRSSHHPSTPMQLYCSLHHPSTHAPAGLALILTPGLVAYSPLGASQYWARSRSFWVAALRILAMAVHVICCTTHEGPALGMAEGVCVSTEVGAAGVAGAAALCLLWQAGVCCMLTIAFRWVVPWCIWSREQVVAGAAWRASRGLQGVVRAPAPACKCGDCWWGQPNVCGAEQRASAQPRGEAGSVWASLALRDWDAPQSSLPPQQTRSD